MTLRLLPFIPPSETRIPDDAKIESARYILDDLDAVLALPFEEMWAALVLPALTEAQEESLMISVPEFLQHFLRYQARNHQRRSLKAAHHAASDQQQWLRDLHDLELQITEKVFWLITKIVNPPAGSAQVEGWAAELFDRHILTTSLLLDIATVYSHDNQDAIRAVFTSVLANEPRFIAELRELQEFVLDEIDDLARRNSKSSGKGKGKGKGSGETGSASRPAPEVAIDILHLRDASLALDNLVRACGHAVSSDLTSDDSTFLRTLLMAHETASLALKQAGDPENDQSTSAPDWYELFIEKQLDASIVSDNLAAADPNYIAVAQSLKLALCQLADTTLRASFIDPLLESPPNGVSNARHHEEGLCDFLLELINQSHFDGPVRFLWDAPFGIDLEVEHDIVDRLKRIKAHSGDQDHARLEYAIASLEHLLTFSGNSEVKYQRMNQRSERLTMRLLSEEAAARSSGDASTKLSPALERLSVNDMTNGATDDLEYVQRSSLISQIHDLFPDLGDGFIEACLMAYNNDVEVVTMKLLEDDLLPHVAALDRSLKRAPPKIQSNVASNPEADEPLSKTLSTRRNITDGDEFDIFSHKKIDMSSVIVGKKQDTGVVLNDPKFVHDQKQAILDMQYDEYDDEYDDTYDTVDIKLAGTVELHLLDEVEGVPEENQRAPPPAPKPAINPAVEALAIHEAEFVALATSNPSIFDIKQRKSPLRAKLRQTTSMSDEQIEGWYKMFLRNPRKDAILSKYEWRGNRANQQPSINKTQSSSESEEDETVESRPALSGDTSRSGASNQRGGPQIGGAGHRGGRGGGQGGGRGGGNSPMDRARKDRNKAKVGNHNRKDGHARKLARGSMGMPE
ncbi:uncharacterized protein BJ171DRAFT_596585 [Polychytrium aggregatum]|uniref:uncharacterized protein n=1 Tax=Polychytrium aggregatum TaxID=110093 RepID=UPI0022FF0DFD|nr:uncharacterized protein BJ171DRAFT_596585 [Polychytrium aggregatum]KAI9207569.1 hypothetical protein BJ171DRAFT_596585 [Polychytrium aggregatum]